MLENHSLDYGLAYSFLNYLEVIGKGVSCGGDALPYSIMHFNYTIKGEVEDLMVHPHCLNYRLILQVLK